MPYASSILQRKFGLGQQYDPDAQAYFTAAGITAGNSTPTAYGTTNLVAYSQQIDNSSGWSGANMTATGGQTDPLGGSTATLLSVNTGFAGSNNYKNLPIPCVVTPSTIYTFSFYAKQGTQTGNNYAVYDPINSVFIVNPTSYASQLNSSTYARVSVTFTTGSNQTQVLVYLSSNSSSVGNWYVWGAQLETGSVATNYVPTTTSSATQVLSSASSRQLINSFVKGVKGLGLWSLMVCWPLRSSQNSSSTTKVYSLGGYGSYVGDLTNSPIYGSNGMAFNGSSNYVNIPSFSMVNVFANYAVFTNTAASKASKGYMAAYGSGDASRSYYYGTLNGGGNYGVLTSPSQTGQTAMQSSNLTPSLNTIHSSGVSYQDGSQSWYLDGTAGTASTFSATTTLTSGSTVFQLGGATQGLNYSTGVFPFFAYFSAFLTPTQHSNFNNTYKQTLGSGLSLP